MVAIVKISTLIDKKLVKLPLKAESLFHKNIDNIDRKQNLL